MACKVELEEQIEQNGTLRAKVEKLPDNPGQIKYPSRADLKHRARELVEFGESRVTESIVKMMEEAANSVTVEPPPPSPLAKTAALEISGMKKALNGDCRGGLNDLKSAATQMQRTLDQPVFSTRYNSTSYTANYGGLKPPGK